MPDEQARTAIFEPAVVVGDLMILAPGQGREIAGDGTIPGSCALTQYEPNRLQAQCQAKRPAYALFAEQWDRGWTATIDGKPTPIARANVVMRAVQVPAGRHVISLTFRPPGLYVGLAFFSIGLSGLTAMALIAFRKGSKGST